MNCKEFFVYFNIFFSVVLYNKLKTYQVIMVKKSIIVNGITYNTKVDYFKTIRQQGENESYENYYRKMRYMLDEESRKKENKNGKELYRKNAYKNYIIFTTFEKNLFLQ